MEEEQDLKDLAASFLIPFLKEDRKKVKMIKDVKRETKNGKKYTLDFLILDEELNEEIGVLCKDWNRSISVNVVNSFVKTIKNLDLSFGIMIADKFSGPARVREENCDSLALINRGQMINWLQSREENLSL